LVGLTLTMLLALPLGVRAEQHFADASANVDRVLALADERMSVMPGVAAYKWQKKLPALDPEREKAVTTHALDVAKTMGLAPEGVREVFDLQVRAARESQVRLHDSWRARGFDWSGPIPSLENDIRPRLDRFTADFLRALYLAAPEFARADFTTTYVARIDTLRAAGWTDADKHALLDALAKIRLLPADPSLSPAARIKSTGVIRIGTTGDYAPFSIDRDGTLTGADIDLAESLANRLQLTPVFVKTSWPTLLNDLGADKFDIAMGGVSITPARAEVAAFSTPYAQGGKAILARCAETGRYPNLAAVDRRGVRVIVNPGGTNEQYVRENVKRAGIRVFPDNTKIFDEISANRADVMITDDVEADLQAKTHPNLCRVSRETLTRADKAILLPKNDELTTLINGALNEAIQAGEPKRLLQQSLNAK
jgi:cyclohexadienyl dehydratase